MSKKFVLTDGQTGYEVIGDYIQRYWENVCYTTVLVTIFSSCDGRGYDRKSIIASPEFPAMALEYDYDWWEGEKYIILSGIVDIHDIVVEGGIFEPLERKEKNTNKKALSLIRKGYSSHDAEVIYECPYCQAIFGDLSLRERDGKEYCPRCEEEVTSHV